MSELFLRLLNMSITAGYLVFAVLLARLFLKKSPKWISCLLWGIVALRLLLPITIESPLSLIPSAEVIPQNITTSTAPALQSGIPMVNNAINPMMTQGVIQSGNIWENVLSVASVIWVIGMAGILLYGMVSYLILQWQIRARIEIQDGVYICDEVSSPFIFGFFRPKIYLPSGLDPETTGYVLLHEKIHLRRKDHWWKPLGYFLLAIYWFNPLLWVAYILLCRDIEQSCDEKVISQMNAREKQGYSLALVSCSQQRRMITVCPVAFGQVSVKTRIKAIVSYKKPSFWILLSSMVLCVVISVCFLTNPETCLHAYADEIVTPATCTQMGVASHTCKRCDYSYTEPIAKCEHTYDEGMVLQAPTCTAEGSKEVTCTACGMKKTVVVEIAPHTAGDMTVLKEPTCVTPGKASTVCTVCGEKYKLELPVNADSHSFEETVVRESTCTEPGEGIKTCKLCDHTESVTYDLAEHTPTGHISFHNDCIYSYDAWYCAVCGYNHVEYLGYGEHAWSNYGIFSDRYVCRYCGVSKEDSENQEKLQTMKDILISPPVPVNP
ncbi:MAG: hypothetical protein IIX23_03325 [Oscillospiraceae bacterium]|nr:hypothetical protein [Oscillospiraceae bacterium]